MRAKNLMSVSVLLGFFAIFTYLLIQRHITEGTYMGLFLTLALCGVVVYFSDRVKEISLRKLVVKLYQQSQQGLTVDKLTLKVGKILSLLSMASAGTAKQRKEREMLIDQLLRSAKASKKEREKVLEDAKLITQLMSTKDEAELEQLRKEIEAKGLLS